MLATLGLAAAVGTLNCARSLISPAERPVRVFVTDAQLERLPFYAAAIRERQAVSPTIWLVAGDPFADNSLAVLSDGAAPAALFSRAGVDAVVLTPEWLEFGLPRLSELVSQGRYYALSASVLDESGRTIGHPLMVRKSGSAVIAITGVAFDSTNVLRFLAGARYVPPPMAAGKALALMRQRGDLVGVMAEPRASGSGWGADFTINLNAAGGFAMSPSPDTGRVNCYDLSPDASRLTATAMDIRDLAPDSVVARLLDSVRHAAGSLAATPIRAPRAWTQGRLRDVLVDGLLASKLADGFLCDSLFAADFEQPTSVGRLVALLRDPRRLAIIPARWDELDNWPRELVLRPGLSRARPLHGQTCYVATTIEYLQRQPDMAAAGFTLTDRPFWTICRDILESGRAK